VQTAKGRGLVTDVAYEADALDKLRQLTGTTAKDKPFPQVSLAQYAPDAQAAAAKKQAATPPPPPPAAAGKPLPLGTVVATLPAGCTSTPVGNVNYFYCGGNFYRAVFQGNSLVYVTAQP